MKKNTPNFSTINRILQISIFLIALCTVYVRFYKNHVELPKGCDEFGYLHMAEAISKGDLLNSHTNRPFFKPLKKHLITKGYSIEEFAWIVAPHAYHINKKSGKIINQYPIGTSSLISIIPKEQRQFLFPLICILLLFILPFMVSIKENKQVQSLQFTLVSLFILVTIITGPFLTEYINVTSVAPTFGLLLAAGICFRFNWKFAAVLIALSINFRLANLILLFPLYLFHILNFVRSKSTQALVTTFSTTTIIGFVLGLLPYSIYTSLLLNDFITSTYSSIDQAPATFNMILSNIEYYFISENNWLYVSLLTLFPLLFFTLRVKRNTHLLIILLLSFLLTYLFFILHAAKTPYYPYGIALLFTGILIRELSTYKIIKLKTQIILNSIIIVGLGITLITNFNKFISIRNTTPNNESQALLDCFGNYDVVWGNLKTGTIEYATGVATMRYNWGGANVRNDIMIWLKDNNYKQAIFLNDLEIRKEELIELKKTMNISLSNNHLLTCGSIIELPIE